MLVAFFRAPRAARMPSPTVTRSKLIISGACITAVLSTSVSFAQPADNKRPRKALEEVIVTAQKRAEDVQSVPLSITAIGGDDIAEKNMGDMNEVANYVPNLDVLATPSFPSIYMRGLGSSYNRGFEQSVALLIDEVYYGRASYINQALLDLETIEVMRGPQGTLFGKNASAGAIHFRTAQPEQEWGGKADVLLGDRDQQRYRLIATGPLSETVSWRAALMSQTRDGSVYNTTIGIDEENIDNQAGRLRLEWAASEDLTLGLSLNATQMRQHGEGSQLILARPRHLAAMEVFDPQTSADPFDELTAKNEQGRVARDAYDATIKADWTFGEDYTLTSITNYSWLDEKVRMDADFSPIPFLILDNNEELRQYSQELRVTSPPGKLEFVSGLFFMNSNIEADYNIRQFLELSELLLVTGEGERTACLQSSNPRECQDQVLNDAAAGRSAGQSIQNRQQAEGGPSPIETALTRFDQMTKSLALFGQATWHFAERWSATLGGRLNYEEKTLDTGHTLVNNRTGGQGNAVLSGSSCDGRLLTGGSYCLGDNPDGASIFPVIIAGDTQFQAERKRSSLDFSPKASVQYELTDSAMAYATVAQGYKSGGYTGQPVNPDNLEFDAETALTYEIGAKSEWLGGAARLNASLFYTDFEDLQVSTFNGVGYVVENAASAIIYGLEYEAMLMTPYSILIGLNGALTESEYSSFDRAACTAENTNPPPCDLTGRRLRLVPELKTTLTLGWQGGLFDWPLLAQAGITASYTTDVALATDLDPIDVRKPGTTYGLQLGIRAEDDSWHLTVFGDNVTSREALAAAQDTPGFRGTHFGGVYPSASYEVELGFRF